MIAFVRGPVAAVTLSSAVLEVGGVGLELMCTPGTLATLSPKVGTGQTATLPTSMVVREDSLTLFGFLDEDEKTCFELLQTASGGGPKLAQAMLAVLSPDELRAAVSGERVVRGAPLAISIRGSTPFRRTRAQKWPSGDMRMRTSSPVTSWPSSPARASSGASQG